jgi:putative DNA primase/helicase
MAVMTGLGIMAATVAGRIQICPSPGYSEPLQIYTATALTSGNRKTGVINEMAAPFREAEARLIAEMTPERKRLQSVRKTAEAVIERLRRQAAAAPESTALIREIAQREIELPEVPAIPRFWTQDVTPERLGAMMAENSGRMAVISDEGGIFDILAGRYSKTASPNLDLFLQGHSGSPVRVDRGSREPVILNSPALTLVLTPQPHVLRSLSEHKAFRGRGLLARFLFVLPPSSVGSRKHETIPIPGRDTIPVR